MCSRVVYKDSGSKTGWKTYSRVERGAAYSDDGVIVVNRARLVLGMAEEVCCGIRLARLFVLNSSKDDGETEKIKRFYFDFAE